MKLRISPSAASLIGAALLFSLGVQAHATNYYINNSGNDSASGTSTSTPWATFANVDSRTFNPGDTIALACGSSWTITTSMTPSGSGTSGSPITITSYNSGSCSAAPVINGNNNSSLTLILLTNASYWVVENLMLENAGIGFYATYNSGSFGNNGITVQNCSFQTMSIFAIYFVPGATAPGSGQYVLSEINLIGNGIEDMTEYGIAFQGAGSNYDDPPNTFQNIVISNNTIQNVGYVAIAFEGATNALVMDNWMYNLGTTYEPQGDTGNFLDGATNVTYVNNYIDGVPNESTTDETAIDVEVYDMNNNFMGNYIGNTYGPGVELLQLSGRSGDYNTNESFLSNTFYDNGQANTVGGEGETSIISYAPSGNTITGTAENNIYYQADNNFLQISGPGTWSQSNNLNAGSTVYNSISQYSGTQGENQWSYEYCYGSSCWVPMTYSSGVWSHSTGAWIDQFDMQPDNSGGGWTGRWWTAPSNGMVTVAGWVVKNTTGTAVPVGIYYDGTWEWGNGSGSYYTMGANDQVGKATNATFAVTAGQVVCFCVGNVSSGDTNAIVSWAPSVVYASSNLLTNPTWATGNLTGWTFYGSPSSVVSVDGPEYAMSGDSYYLAEQEGSGSMNVAEGQENSSMMGLTPGTPFTASVWAVTLNSNNAYLYVGDGVYTTTLCSVTLPATDETWTQYTCSGYVDSTGNLFFSLGSGVDSGNAFAAFDSASLTVN